MNTDDLKNETPADAKPVLCAVKIHKMQDYTWSTETSHSNNTETMQDYLHNHLHESLTYLFQDGSYAEAINETTNERCGIHASGNGDFNNHRVRFELLS